MTGFLKLYATHETSDVPTAPSKLPFESIDLALMNTLVTLSITFEIPFINV